MSPESRRIGSNNLFHFLHTGRGFLKLKTMFSMGEELKRLEHTVFSELQLGALRLFNVRKPNSPMTRVQYDKTHIMIKDSSVTK